MLNRSRPHSKSSLWLPLAGWTVTASFDRVAIPTGMYSLIATARWRLSSAL